MSDIEKKIVVVTLGDQLIEFEVLPGGQIGESRKGGIS